MSEQERRKPVRFIDERAKELQEQWFPGTVEPESRETMLPVQANWDEHVNERSDLMARYIQRYGLQNPKDKKILEKTITLSPEDKKKANQEVAELSALLIEAKERQASIEEKLRRLEHRSN